RDALTKFLDAVAIDRVARDDRRSQTRRLRIETRRAITAAHDLQLEIVIGEREHPLVLVERAAPRNDLIEREHRSNALTKVADTRLVPVVPVQRPLPFARRKPGAAPPLLTIEVTHRVRLPIDYQDRLTAAQLPSDLVLGRSISADDGSPVVDVERIANGTLHRRACVEVSRVA